MKDLREDVGSRGSQVLWVGEGSEWLWLEGDNGGLCVGRCCHKVNLNLLDYFSGLQRSVEHRGHGAEDEQRQGIFSCLDCSSKAVCHILCLNVSLWEIFYYFLSRRPKRYSGDRKFGHAR